MTGGSRPPRAGLCFARAVAASCRPAPGSVRGHEREFGGCRWREAAPGVPPAEPGPGPAAAANSLSERHLAGAAGHGGQPPAPTGRLGRWGQLPQGFCSLQWDKAMRSSSGQPVGQKPPPLRVSTGRHRLTRRKFKSLSSLGGRDTLQKRKVLLREWQKGVTPVGVCLPSTQVSREHTVWM